MNTRGLTELGYKIFLDRYSTKDTKRETLKPGDLVLVKTNDNTGQKEIGELVSLENTKANVILHPGDDNSEYIEIDVEHVDKPLELDPAQMWNRVALAMAEQEQTSEKFEEWLDKFKWLLEDWKFLPGGRILAAAGTNTELTYYNCYVIPSPKDSKDEIFKSVNNMAQLMARGGGVGVNISSLRPRYAYAKSTNGRSSGAVSWGELYSYTTGLIEQGGSRRGALLLMLNDWHPDILEYINVKRDNKRIINANISVAISEEFIDAVENNMRWELVFPDTTHPNYDVEWDGDLHKWESRGYPCKVWGNIKARELWDAIIESAWACAEPGLWFVDRVNEFSNSHYYAPLISTNPCGEISLPQWGCCNLGAINLSKFVVPVIGEDHWTIDWKGLQNAVRYAVRFLDNVIDATPYVYEEIKQQQLSERRVGLGTMGLAEVLIRLKLRYGSEESLKFIDELYKFIAYQAYVESIELAKERGSFPKFDLKILDSEFMKHMPEPIQLGVEKYGLRNVTLLTQAPTGTIGTMVNTSTGIEPFYFWQYERKGRLGSHTERVKVYDEWISFKNEREYFDGDTMKIPDWFVTAQDLIPEEHVRVQAAIQRWVDSSISKTCNVPEDYTVEQIGELYKLMHELGCKGGTVYRDKSRDEQILNLTNSSVLNNTQNQNVDLDMDMEVKLEVSHPSTSSNQLGDDYKWRSRPSDLAGNTYRKNTAIGTAYITVNHNGTGEPFETFIAVGKAGSDVAADAEGIGRLISLILRMPSPLDVKERIENIAAQLSGIGSGKQYGFGKQRVMSLPDAIAQVLVEHIGITGGLPNLPEYAEANEPKTMYYNGDGDICPGCGNASLMRVEGCQKCYSCGYSQC